MHSKEPIQPAFIAMDPKRLEGTFLHFSCGMPNAAGFIPAEDGVARIVENVRAQESYRLLLLYLCADFTAWRYTHWSTRRHRQAKGQQIAAEPDPVWFERRRRCCADEIG